MEPISLAITLGTIAFRWITKNDRNNAKQELRDASQSYERSRRLLIDEQNKCVTGCCDLAASRQGAIGLHWDRLNRMLKAAGLQRGIFGIDARLFGDRSEQEVLAIISITRQLLALRHPHIPDQASLAVGVAAMIQGVELLDSANFIHVDLLHETIGDAIASLPLDHADSLANSLGDVGDFGVADILGDALAVFSIFRSFGSLLGANELRGNASEIRTITYKINAKRQEFKSTNENVKSLLHELESMSYDLFKWTILAQEMIGQQQVRTGHGGPGMCVLPDWMIEGLCRRAAALWSNLQKPAFA